MSPLTYTTNSADYHYSAHYHCLICGNPVSVDVLTYTNVPDYTFSSWFDHVAIHFSNAYAQVLDFFVKHSGGSKSFNFPLIPGSSTPFVFIISIPVNNGMISSYASSADFLTLTSPDNFRLYFESLAFNLFINAIDQNQIARPTLSPVSISYTVDFYFYSPLPKLKDFRSFEYLPISSPNPFSDFLFSHPSSTNTFVVLFHNRILDCIKSLLKLSSFKSYVAVLDSGKPLVLSLDSSYYTAALEVIYSRTIRSLRIIEPAHSRELAVDRLNLGTFLYEASSLANDAHLSIYDRENYHLLLSLFYYLLSVAVTPLFPSITVTDLFKTPKLYSSIHKMVILSQDISSFFQTNPDEEVSSGEYSFDIQCVCRVCKNNFSFQSYELFFDHISKHFLASYSNLLNRLSKSSIPLIDLSDNFIPFVVKFTPLNYNI